MYKEDECSEMYTNVVSQTVENGNYLSLLHCQLGSAEANPQIPFSSHGRVPGGGACSKPGQEHQDPGGPRGYQRELQWEQGRW